MNRFTLSFPAQRDLDDIEEYLLTLPEGPALKLGRIIQNTLVLIAEYPFQGVPQSAFSLLAGAEVRSRLCRPYRIFYQLSGCYPEVIGIIHTSRDLPTIMERRQQ